MTDPTSPELFAGIASDDMNERVATSLFLVVWKSREPGRYKVGPGMWGQLRGFLKASAKSSTNIPKLIEDLMPRVGCTSLSGFWIGMVMYGENPTGDDESTVRGYLQDIRAVANEKRVLDILTSETVTVIELAKQWLDERKVERETRTKTDQLELFGIDPDSIIDVEAPI